MQVSEISEKYSFFLGWKKKKKKMLARRRELLGWGTNIYFSSMFFFFDLRHGLRRNGGTARSLILLSPVTLNKIL